MKTASAFKKNLFKFSENLTFSATATATFSLTVNSEALAVSPTQCHITVRFRDFTELSQNRKLIYILISKIVQVVRASSTDCYGIFLLLFRFCVNQTKSKLLGKVKNIKESFIPSIYINKKNYHNKGIVINSWIII